MKGAEFIMFCCEDMKRNAYFNCSNHDNKYLCPDCLIEYNKIFDEYGIILHDGGLSCILINYCPWCGSKLPESKRDLWFDTLEQLGYDEPFEQDIPDDFKTDRWYQK